ncbi:hypothetical protein VTP01DRAFT_244 [Rhizomucor pusillus]|uniref:uncharacterized protein n=1 Tax=Rhizomucor pusillus TaxID=4840 RepID=UPI003742520A
MDNQFFYEDGHGNVVDEYGRPEPMDYLVDEETYALETVSLHTQYLCNMPRASEREPVAMQTDEPKDADRKKNGRPRILTEEYKKVIVEYVDENPSVVLEQLMERLLQKFEGLKISKSTLYEFVRTKNCVFLDESAFHINMKRSMAWSKKGSPAVVTVHKTTTILGAISASGLIKCSLRLPQPPAKKRKRGGHVDLISTGTVTGHYLSFLKATMDEMDKYPHMKGHYLVMDNAPIHKSEDIQ